MNDDVIVRHSCGGSVDNMHVLFGELSNVRLHDSWVFCGGVHSHHTTECATLCQVIMLDKCITSGNCKLEIEWKI